MWCPHGADAFLTGGKIVAGWFRCASCVLVLSTLGLAWACGGESESNDLFGSEGGSGPSASGATAEAGAVARAGQESQGGSSSAGESSSSAGQSSSAGGSSGGVTSEGGSNSAAGEATGGSSEAGGSVSEGGSAPERPNFDTDLPDDTPIAEIDEEEYQDLCAQFEDMVTEIAESLDAADLQCRGTAITVAFVLSGIDPQDPSTLADASDEEFEANCMDSYDQCLETADPASRASFDCNQPGADCDVTLGDLEQCLADVTTFSARLDNAIPSCDGITVARALTALLLLQAQGQAEFQSDACDKLDACGGAGGAAGAPGQD